MQSTTKSSVKSRNVVIALGFSLAAPWVATASPCGAPVGYPSFCSIPQIPRDVPTADAFKAVIVDTRLSGRSLEQNTDPSHFSLENTEDFAVQAKLSATAPPPITTPDQGDTETFLRAARARVTPPPKPH